MLLFLPAAALLAQMAASRSEPLAFTHVTVIDATGAPPAPDMTVVVRGDRISELGKTGKVPIPNGSHLIDATGKFLIPGLWDMHVHVLRKGRPETFFPYFLANGVTGVRDMGGDLAGEINQLRRRLADGTLPGPHIVAPGPVIDGPKPESSFSIAVADEVEARRAVHSLKRQGVDFVKVYSLLPRSAYFAVADETRKLAIPFAGHVPYSVSAAEVSDAGQRSIEHMNGVLLSSSTSEPELRKQLIEAMIKPDAPGPLPAVIRAQTKQLLDTFDVTRAATLFARFARNGTWQCPTLVVLRAFAFLDDDNFINDARLKYIPFSMRERWKPSGHLRSQGDGTEDFANRKRVFLKQLELIPEMHLAGVPLIAGTDSPTPYVFPGFSLHDELILLAKAGLSPMEALQTATRNPAQYLGISGSLGTIEKGKIADLVLLDANPLQDISNTQRIAAVVFGGKLIARSSLQAMLAKIEAAARRN